MSRSVNVGAMRKPRATRFFVAAGLTTAQAGCTQSMWQSANEPDVRVRSIAGTLDTPAGRALVIRYSPFGTADERETLLVPLDAVNRPVAPFALAPAAADLSAGITAEQAGQIRRRAEGTLVVGGLAEGLTPVGGPLAIGGDRSATASEVILPADGVLTAVAYRVDGRGHLNVVPFDVPEVHFDFDGGGHNHARVPRGAIVLLVPADLRRPPTVLAAAQARARLLTPVTVAADVPIYVGGAVVFVAILPFVVAVTVIAVHGIHVAPAVAEATTRPSSRPDR